MRDINSYDRCPSYKEFMMLDEYVHFLISLKMGAFEDTLREVDGITEQHDKLYEEFKEYVDDIVREKYNGIWR